MDKTNMITTVNVQSNNMTKSVGLSNTHSADQVKVLLTQAFYRLQFKEYEPVLMQAKLREATKWTTISPDCCSLSQIASFLDISINDPIPNYTIELRVEFDKKTQVQPQIPQELKAIIIPELTENFGRYVYICDKLDQIAQLIQQNQPASSFLSTVSSVTTKPVNEQDIYFHRTRNRLYQTQEYFIQSIPKASLSKAKIKYATQQAALRPVKENEEQHPIFMRIIKDCQCHITKRDNHERIREIQLVNGMLVNYPARPTLDTLKPDVVLFQDKMKGPIKTVVELTLQEPIDPLHLGKGIRNNEMILKQQPERQFVISMVTNLKQVVFIKSFKPRKNERVSTGFMTKALDFIDSLGIIWTLLNGQKDYTGFAPLVVNPSNIAVTTFKFIGAGATSHCYQSTSHNDLVIKKFYSQEFFETERRIYQYINLKRKERPSSQITHLMTLVDQDRRNLVLVFQGLGRSIRTEEYRSKRVILSMINCLKELNELSIVHRDITRRHFLIRQGSDSHVMLIDLGCSTIRNGEVISYRGTAHLAANQVLQSVADGERYVPEFRHDWESFVKMLMIQNGYVTYSNLRALNNTEPRHFKEIVDYWTGVEFRLLAFEPTNPFLKVLQSCRKPNMTLDLLQSGFQPIIEPLADNVVISPPLEHVGH